MTIAARGLTDVGQRRDHNEDSFLVDERLGLFVVADGMGGHAGGGTASRLAVETIRDRVQRAREVDPGTFSSRTRLDEHPARNVLREAVETACSTIFHTAQREPALAGMGTTVTAVLVVEGVGAFVAHVGDSRCYLVRGGRIYQVSEDHSLVNEQLKSGAITLEEARTSRFRNIITRSVGFEEAVLVDLMGLVLQPGDRLLVCSDGLTNMVDDAQLLEVSSTSPVEQIPQRLVDRANAAGGEDNVTVVVLRVD
ncbi:MAG TPA: Stp1/IreP family PP2C-type Ser/Thr phosphatase [Anaeromyxobacteraceae bacterium]|jgi:protein phosphatase|nr:Stp1/IreP family PP2C-type Ser/Thr phosphatase [Anaeromyxobacteraceae bacterium]